MSHAAGPVLAIDLGGTKTLLALVDGSTSGPAIRLSTEANAGPESWLDAIAAAAGPWHGAYESAAIAVTGLVAGERWWTLNPSVLPIPPGFPLVEGLRRRLGVPVFALNDAQAAAWGEYRFGAAQGADMVFVTVSTGIGAGIVLGGRLLTGHRGLAGHLGQWRCAGGVDSPWLEHLASGTALAREAAMSGDAVDVAGLFAEAAAGSERAAHVIDRAARRLAAALVSVQALLDPDCIVIGGGVGLAPGLLARLRDCVSGLPEPLRPDLRGAALGAEAGLLGVADFAQSERNKTGTAK
jgi:predicted NBD/HSP70 family sugar kinase